MCVRHVANQGTVLWCAGAKLEKPASWVQETLQLNPSSPVKIAQWVSLIFCRICQFKIVHIPPAAALKCSQFLDCAHVVDSGLKTQIVRPGAPWRKKNKRQPSASSAVPEFA